MKITCFEDLEVWQRATTLAVQVNEVSKDGEFSRDFGFRDQIRRAAVSIPSNIAEGKERETVPEFIRYLYIAKGSTSELKTQLLIANQVRYMNEENYRKLREKAQHVSAMIGALIKTLKSQSRVSRSSR